MAYTDQDDLIRAAGGEANLLELADLAGAGDLDATEVQAVIAAAQAAADGWIDMHARRLHGARLPFGAGVLADVDPYIRKLAADETVYRLKVSRRVQSDRDDRLHDERKDEIAALSTGASLPAGDTYPVGGGGGAPMSADRTSASVDGVISREDLKGFA